MFCLQKDLDVGDKRSRLVQYSHYKEMYLPSFMLMISCGS